MVIIDVTFVQTLRIQCQAVYGALVGRVPKLR